MSASFRMWFHQSVRGDFYRAAPVSYGRFLAPDQTISAERSNSIRSSEISSSYFSADIVS